MKHGGARLFAADGTEFTFAAQLERIEVERLLTLEELDAVRVECGGGVESWVGPADARRLWLDVEPDLEDVDGWRPPDRAAVAPYDAPDPERSAGRVFQDDPFNPRSTTCGVAAWGFPFGARWGWLTWSGKTSRPRR